MVRPLNLLMPVNSPRSRPAFAGSLSMAPTIAAEALQAGSLRVASPIGPNPNWAIFGRTTSWTSQVVLELVDMLALGLSPQEAIAAPRIHHQWFPNELIVEDSLSPQV